MDPTLILLLAVLAPAWHLGLLTAPEPSTIKYSRDYLLKFENPAISGPPVDLVFPDLEEIVGHGDGDYYRGPQRKPRKQGRRGGVRQCMRQQHLSRIPLPSIILSSAWSLCNKTEELQALVRHQHEFKEACILAFTETNDRASATTEKLCGGGVCACI